MASESKETNCKVSSSDEGLKSPNTCNSSGCHGVAENQATSSSTPNNPSSRESTACLITPNIHINHLYVYNFTPELGRYSSPIDTKIIKVPFKYQSPAASSGPICRICHEGDDKEDLVSPCRCTGTVGLVHKACMERWLSTRCNVIDKCEICNYEFVTTRSPKSFFEFIRSDENNAAHRRSFMGDLTCFFLLTPLALVSSFLCVEGAKRQVVWGNSLEAGCLMALATFLITIYVVWNVLTLRFHLKVYFKWRAKHHNVKLVKVKRISTASDGPNRTCIQVVTQDPNNNSTNVVISIPDSAVPSNQASAS